MSDGRGSKDGLNKDEWLKDDWLKYLESVHPADIELGLGRVTKVAKTLDLFKPAPVVIVVGGTNGKGTTTALLAQLLVQKGLTSGSYNSPHIHQYNERINHCTADGGVIMSTDEELCAAFLAIEQGRGETLLTYFEFGTLAALWQIKKWQLDVAILEVGLGGRLDAVNIVETDLAIVTSVGLDHQDWLGDTLDLIGYEKAGIGRSGKPLICGQPDVSQGFLDHSSTIGASLLLTDKDYSIFPLEEAEGWLLKFDGRSVLLPKGHIPFYNIASSIVGLNAIGLLPSEQGLAFAVEHTSVPGRLTRYSCLYKNRVVNFMLDVAHNPQAASFVASQVEHCKHGILALLQDKDPNGIVQKIPMIKSWHLAGIKGFRGQTVKQLEKRLSTTAEEKISSVHDDVEGAMLYCLDSLEEGETVLVIGSFLTVSAAEEFILSYSGLEVVTHGE